MIIAAHHEAGHIVVAPVGGLRLRPEGIIVDSDAQGLACYCKDPSGSDLLRKRIITATFAGFYAERRSSEKYGYPVPEENWLGMGDGWEANELVNQISVENLTDGSNVLTADEGKRQSLQLVTENWCVIEAVAEAVLLKEWGPIPALNSGIQWSKETMGKHLPGEEIVGILVQHGIPAECVSER